MTSTKTMLTWTSSSSHQRHHHMTTWWWRLCHQCFVVVDVIARDRRRYAVVVVAVYGVTMTSTLWWWRPRRHRRRKVKSPSWSLRWPRSSRHCEDRVVTSLTSSLMHSKVVGVVDVIIHDVIHDDNGCSRTSTRQGHRRHRHKHCRPGRHRRNDLVVTSSMSSLTRRQRDVGVVISMTSS